MQLSLVLQLRLLTAVVVMRRCTVILFEKPEVIDKAGSGGHRHTTSYNAGMIDTANVACMSDIWHNIVIILYLYYIVQVLIVWLG